MKYSQQIIKQNPINQRKTACTKASDRQNINRIQSRRSLNSRSRQQQINHINRHNPQNHADNKIQKNLRLPPQKPNRQHQTTNPRQRQRPNFNIHKKLPVLSWYNLCLSPWQYTCKRVFHKIKNNPPFPNNNQSI